MTLNQLMQAGGRQPFQPFRLILADGRQFFVDHPEFFACDRRGREVTFYAEDNTQHFLDTNLIAEIVTVSQPAATGPDGGTKWKHLAYRK